MYRKNLMHFLLLALTTLALTACVGVPVEKRSSPSAAQRLEAQSARFAEGKALFLSKQYAAAAAILLPLAQQGHPAAQYTIGYMYHYGYGLPRNAKESTRWIATAAARGNPQAKQALERINASHDQRGVLPTAPPAQTRPGVIRLE
jgi:TPR repeat protein